MAVMGKSLYGALSLLLWLWAPVFQAEAAEFAVRGIALGEAKDSARARLQADNPQYQTRQDPVYPELERDLASSLWNLEACQPSRGTVTRTACTRTEVQYNHSKLGARAMAIDFTQTLNPTVPAEIIQKRLEATYGPPDAETEMLRGFFRTPYGRTLAWEDGDRRLEAVLYFYDGEAARTIALSLKAVDQKLLSENQALMAEIDTDAGASGEGQITF